MGMIPEVFFIEDVDDSFAIDLAFAIESRRFSINKWYIYDTSFFLCMCNTSETYLAIEIRGCRIKSVELGYSKI